MSAACANLGDMELAAVFGLPAEDWSAIATCTGVLIALGVGRVAYIQVGEARRLREEQAQPYVAVYMEPSGAGPWMFDLVIKNFGATAAIDVRVETRPPPLRANGKELALPEDIPVLVPGQEWRTFWDSTQARHGAGMMEDRHDAVVTFKDSKGKAIRLPYVLDWKTARRGWVDVYGEHHAAKALREIAKTVGEWTEGRKGIAVSARDGDAKDKRREEHFKELYGDDEYGPQESADAEQAGQVPQPEE